MPKNSSNNEKTVKDIYSSAERDSWVIDRILVYGNYLDKCIIPVENILDLYQDYFEQYLEDYELPEKYYYQPAAFSENYYGTPDLDFVVLYFAKMSSLYEFNKKNIKVLPLTKMTELNQLFIRYKNKVDESYDNPTTYLGAPLK